MQPYKIILLFLLTTALAACGGSSDPCSSFDEPGENWVWNGTVCQLRRDGFNWGVSSISPALDGSEDLYIVGSFTYFKNQAIKHIARLNKNGSLDRGFVTGTGFNYTPDVVVSANDGSGDIYVGGMFSSYNGSTVPGIARLNQDGSLDLSFDTGTTIGGVRAIVPATDGSGDVYVDGPIRLNIDGSVDVDFNPGFYPGRDSIALATDGSGDIYVSGNIAPYIARLNNDGSIDTEFDTGPSGFDRWVTDIAVATDGSGDIYVVGFFSEYNGTSTNGLARLNSDGSFDTDFVVDTKVFRGGRIILPALDGSGDIYVRAASNTNNQDIVRLNDDGSIDAGFGIGSEGFNPGGHPNDAAIAIDGSGDIYVAGDFTHYNLTPAVNLIRLTAGGVLVK